MKFIVSGDIHCHLFTNYAVNKNKEDNSRHKVIMRVLNDMLKYAKDNKITKIILNGDIFETKSSVDAIVNNAFWDWCVSAKHSDIQIYLNTGNHDIASLHDESITLLHPYKDLENVILAEKPLVINEDDCIFAFLPFRRNIDEVKDNVHALVKKCSDLKCSNKPKFLFYHGAVFGALISQREFLNKAQSVTTEDLKSDYFDFIFLSHFHKPQAIKDCAMYVGSPLHHTLHDAGDSKGFAVFDTESFSINFVKTSYPPFNKIVLNGKADLHKVSALDPTTGYYKIEIASTDINEDDLKAFKNIPNIQICRNVEEVAAKRIDITPNSDIFTIIDLFVDNDKSTQLNKNTLKSIGKLYAKKFKRG